MYALSKPQQTQQTLTFDGGILAPVMQVAKWPLLIYLHGSGGGTFLSFTKRSERCEGLS